MSNLEDRVIKVLKAKMEACDGESAMPVLKGEPIPFWESPTGLGLEVEQLKDFIIEWKELAAIVEKANELGGKMYRGDQLAQRAGAKLGEEIPYECMEGFIASELLGIPDGNSITRRSTYYSGILAWAGIVQIHRSTGKGSYITINSEYRE